MEGETTQAFGTSLTPRIPQTPGTSQIPGTPETPQTAKGN